MIWFALLLGLMLVAIGMQLRPCLTRHNWCKRWPLIILGGCLTSVGSLFLFMAQTKNKAFMLNF
ncbi:MAG: hypothetical protein K2M12_01520, partial [Muribaculaceae bacterium]|nr:hypothetical protein [Muribaculaceae bacterium]